MAFSLDKVQGLYSKYKSWIRKNPERTEEYETTAKWISYLLAGRISNSTVSTEAAYALSSLLVFHNDRIIQSPIAKGPARQIKEWLAILEYLEVVLEVSAKIRGPRLGWLIVGIVQALKSALRLTLLFKYKESVICSPAIPTLKRSSSSTASSSTSNDAPTISFKLKRSGRVIRKVEASPSNGNRLWQPPPTLQEANEIIDEEDPRYELHLILGEVVHSLRPIAHLLATYRYGFKSWKPWLLSLSMDVYSYSCLRLRRKYANKDEKEEASRRALRFLMYLIRSPFYERHSEDRIAGLLDAISNNVVLLGYLAKHTKNYIPFFQSTYSYSWSN